MKIEIAGIQVSGGEFSIRSPEATGLNPPDQEEGSVLHVFCQFGLVDTEGNIIASGNASNSPVASGLGVTLSDATLEAFQKFFNYLEHDVANALESKDRDSKQQKLEKILAGEISE